MLWYVATASYFVHVEGYTWQNAFFSCSTTITTVGYGFVTPVTVAGRVGSIVSILFGLTIVTACIGMMVLRVKRLAKSRLSNKKSDADHRYESEKDLVSSIALFASMIIIGATFVRVSENFSWLDSFYWAVVSAGAVGYGDLPMGPTTRAFCIFYLPVAVLSCGACATGLVSLLLQRETERRTQAFIERGITPEMIREISPDGYQVGKHEFMTYLLLGQGKLQQEDVAAAAALFK
eukprot:3414487-Prymnesium_polylepis.1